VSRRALQCPVQTAIGRGEDRSSAHRPAVVAIDKADAAQTPCGTAAWSSGPHRQ
jgi:hypothetical protein